MYAVWVIVDMDTSRVGMEFVGCRPRACTACSATSSAPPRGLPSSEPKHKPGAGGMPRGPYRTQLNAPVLPPLMLLGCHVQLMRSPPEIAAVASAAAGPCQVTGAPGLPESSGPSTWTGTLGESAGAGPPSCAHTASLEDTHVVQTW